MTITSNDIKIFQAQDNTDNDSGGGARTSTEIVDGNVNNLFPDISRIDTVSGDVALRKVFPTVYTLNRDVYYGAHAIIRKKPTDPKVSALLFHSDDPFDKRLAAQNKIESYVAASYGEQFWLFGNHVAGSKSVTFLSSVESPLPVVGEVYLLIDPSSFEQYVRIVDITPQVVNLNYNLGDQILVFQRKRIICELEQSLEYAFVGSEFDPVGQQPNTTTTYATQIADAAKFYGTRNLAEDVLINDSSIKVDSIYEALVPSSKAQSPLINQSAMFGAKVLKHLLTPYTFLLTSPGGSWSGSLGIGFKPGTLKFSPSYIDDEEGNIVAVSDPTIPLASVDYTTGDIDNSNGLLTIGGSVSITLTPSMVIDGKYQYTGSILITNQSQGLVFVKTLSPMPSPGVLYVDYRSQGKWYRVQGNYDYTIGGDPSIGAGNVSDNGDGTGTMSLTLGSLPDIDSSLIVSWGSAQRVRDLSSDAHSLELVFDLGREVVDPTSLIISAKNSSSISYDITSDANGVLSDEAGTITGYLDHIKGEVVITGVVNTFRFQSPGSPDDVTISFDYSSATSGQQGYYDLAQISDTDVITWSVKDTVNHIYSTNIGANCDIKSVRVRTYITYNYDRIAGYNADPVTIREGYWVDLSGADGSGNLAASDGLVYGTISANGDITINPPEKTISYPAPGTGVFPTTPRYNSTLARGDVDTAYVTRVQFYTTAPAVFSASELITDKIENIAKYRVRIEDVISGEVAFRAFDNSSATNSNFYSLEGVIYDRSGMANAPVQRGTIDYTTGEILINYYRTTGSSYYKSIVLAADESASLDRKQYIFDFRTSSTSLVPSSLQLRYHLAEAGSPLRNAVTDQNGNITGTGINSANSYVDTETGMVHLEFSTLCYSDSILYDAVAQINIPIDAELLGLNPVRLPSDGRVPVFQPGRHLVIFDEATTPTTNPTPLADDVETLARSGQAYIEVIDSEGKRLNPNEYIADRTAGTVTFGNPLTLEDKYGTPLVAPFYIVDRVEDMLLATDVQINGDILLSASLTHNYTAANSKVASALVWGDTGSRVYNLFSQEIWNSGNPVWSDSLIGDPTTQQYDDINYPIQVDNQSSTSGRWAIIFVSSTTVQVAHEKLGIVATSISISVSDVAPINPATGSPYFTMDRNGFGAGWVSNNVIRFNTDSGDQNMWVIRTVQSGALSELTDNIELEIRGDAN